MKASAPPEVCAVKLALRQASHSARDARKAWYAAKVVCALAEAVHLTHSDLEAGDIGITTIKMWAAERALAQWAERWREVLAAREALPVAERWNLAALEKWAQAQVETL